MSYVQLAAFLVAAQAWIRRPVGDFPLERPDQKSEASDLHTLGLSKHNDVVSSSEFDKDKLATDSEFSGREVRHELVTTLFVLPGLWFQTNLGFCKGLDTGCVEVTNTVELLRKVLGIPAHDFTTLP